MLRVGMLNFNDKWIDCLPYAELAYNNNHQSSIEMAPFEALYRQKCQVPLYWDWTKDGQINKTGEV
jgi:hypothetical protein